jgi:hypothetical protein
MACAICEVRRPRRYCPGVRGDICTVCCGTEREATVDCPFDCPYLQEARTHERIPPADPDQFPNRDIKVTEDFLQENEDLLVFTGKALLEAAFHTPGAIDFDIREALEALIRTYRSLQSGLYYETRPNNPMAAGISALLQQSLDEFRKEERERLGMSRTRDADVLGIFAFLQRLELDRNNGRRRGRAFMDFLRTSFGAPVPADNVSPLIVP